MTETEKSEPAFLRLPQVLSLIPVSKSTWWAWVAAGTAPQPLKLSERVTVWRKSDIQDFISEKSIGDSHAKA